MIRSIKELHTEYNGDLILDKEIKEKINKKWQELIIGKDPKNFFNGDIYCVTSFDESIPLIIFSKTKFASLMYAKETKEIMIHSLFSASYVRTSDNYVCIILNYNNKLNTIGGLASDEDIINNKFDYKKCLIREFKEELGIDLNNNEKFDIYLRFLKHPKENEMGGFGTLFEIKTKYTHDELQGMFNNNDHDSEVKQLIFFNQDNYKEILNHNLREVYFDELFDLIFS